VETSRREAFNIGYDVVLISDATASSNYKHYESTLENVRGYYGVVMDLEELSRYLPASAQQPTQMLRTDISCEEAVRCFLRLFSVQPFLESVWQFKDPNRFPNRSAGIP